MLREAGFRVPESRTGSDRHLGVLAAHRPSALGVVRQTFGYGDANTMKLTRPLVPDARKQALIAELAERTPSS
jgi:hypothetical protein